MRPQLEPKTNELNKSRFIETCSSWAKWIPEVKSLMCHRSILKSSGLSSFAVGSESVWSNRSIRSIGALWGERGGALRGCYCELVSSNVRQHVAVWIWQFALFDGNWYEDVSPLLIGCSWITVSLECCRGCV